MAIQEASAQQSGDAEHVGDASAENLPDSNDCGTLATHKAAGHSLLWGSVARSPIATLATAQPRPFPEETSPVASAWASWQIHWLQN